MMSIDNSDRLWSLFLFALFNISKRSLYIKRYQLYMHDLWYFLEFICYLELFRICMFSALRWIITASCKEQLQIPNLHIFLCNK